MRISSVSKYSFKSSAPVIDKALKQLEQVEFEQNDVMYIKSFGINPPFKCGHEIVDFIKNNNIQIEFSKFNESDVHAKWNYSDNKIHINDKYKNLDSFAGILGLSEAISHEACHAKDFDFDNSIQEELDCMSINVLVHRYNKKTYKDIFLGQNSNLFREGVSLYEKLFFEFDIQKNNLKKRMIEKYGFLPLNSKGHKAFDFAKSIKKESI